MALIEELGLDVVLPARGHWTDRAIGNKKQNNGALKQATMPASAYEKPDLFW